MPSAEIVIKQTRKWITDVVIGCNFCPFAKKEIKNETVGFTVIQKAGIKEVLETIAGLFYKMEDDEGLKTVLVILPERFDDFLHYLSLVDTVQLLLEKERKKGIFQLASFHPSYKFAGTTENDASNYTNRSPYPIIQILRESSISKVTETFKGIHDIPQQNVNFTKKAGLDFMISLRNESLGINL